MFVCVTREEGTEKRKTKALVACMQLHAACNKLMQQADAGDVHESEDHLGDAVKDLLDVDVGVKVGLLEEVEGEVDVLRLLDPHLGVLHMLERLPARQNLHKRNEVQPVIKRSVQLTVQSQRPLHKPRVHPRGKRLQRRTVSPGFVVAFDGRKKIFQAKQEQPITLRRTPKKRHEVGGRGGGGRDGGVGGMRTLVCWGIHLSASMPEEERRRSAIV